MTAVLWEAAPAPTPVQARAARLDQLIFIGAVGVLLVFSQGWIAPLLGENIDPADSGLVRDAFLPFYLIGLAMLALQPLRSLLALVRQPFLIGLSIIVCVSVLWSINPAQTERRAFALVCTTLCGVALGARWRWPRLAEVVGACFAILCAASLFVCIALPSIGKMHDAYFPGAWRGLWTEKNAFGDNMALAFTGLAAAAVLNPRRKWLWGGFAALAFLMVLASTSKTSLVALTLGGITLAAVSLARRGPVWSVLVIWGGISAIGVLACFIALDAKAALGLLGKDSTLTGRTEIWSAIWRQIHQRPLTGYGYGAIWNDTSGRGPLAWITKEAGFRPQHAHNSWLEQWLSVGLIGLIAFALFYIQTLLTALVAVFRSRGALLVFPYLVVYSLTTLTESIAVVYNDLRWVLLVAFAIKLAWPDRLIPDPNGERLPPP